MILDKEFYSTIEVGKIFGVTPYTVKDWIKNGSLSATKPSGTPKGHWRISKSEVKRLAEEKYGEK